MTDPDRRLLLSLKPRFASAIFDGSKTIELRRTRPRIEIPTEALIYASSPKCALVGTCQVVEVLEFTPLGLWRLHGNDAALDYAEFKTYFTGANTAYGLMLTRPRRLETEISLSEMRGIWEGFQPPQSFRYLTTEISDRILVSA